MSHSFDLPGVIVHQDAFDPHDDRPWVPFPDGVEYLRERHDALIAACVAWTADQGRDVDPDVIAVLCGAAAEGFNGGSVTRWTVERMYHMLCCHILNWCDDHHAEVPDDVFKEPLWLFINFLVASDRLDDSSDPPDLLLRVLHCHGINASGFESNDEADWHHDDAPFEYDAPAADANSWRDGHVIMAAEAKARVKGGDGLMALRRSFERLEADPSVKVSKGHRRKWDEVGRLVEAGPIELLLVADGARWWFEAIRDEESIRLRELERPRLP